MTFTLGRGILRAWTGTNLTKGTEMSWTAECPKCGRMFTNELGRPKECETCVTKEAEDIAAIAEANEDNQSMVESSTDRKLFAEMNVDQPQPKVTDFTEVLPMLAEPEKYVLRVKLDSGASIAMATGISKDEAERRELAINQVMIEYRTKLNAWEENFANNYRKDLGRKLR